MGPHQASEEMASGDGGHAGDRRGHDACDQRHPEHHAEDHRINDRTGTDGDHRSVIVMADQVHRITGRKWRGAFWPVQGRTHE